MADTSQDQSLPSSMKKTQVLASKPSRTLAVPTADDTPSTLVAKLDQIQQCLDDGGGLAAATDYSRSTISSQSVAEIARSEMTPVEARCWEAYVNGTCRLPAIDWDVDRGETPTSKKGLQKAGRRAEALNRLYGSDRAEPCHAVWFAVNHPVVLQVVKAMARVIGAESRSGQSEGVDSDLADLQTIRAVVATSMEALQRNPSAFKPHTKDINKRLHLLREHQRKIQLRRLARAHQPQPTEPDKASLSSPPDPSP
ncbi:hypothetical protein A1O3_03953 [Capronia epimyces CBS 606.96]|uniref:Uncharacterized protein n=1 Tax=Capronia epimyces CBS 606.96 TaxID=1182542 RepID=W9YCM5_9EURO|nr:uncharacterized protein A1O3_03953 [Capronia epimyces CBS 606.96]EXJ86996.1 hypothetical protein A1O3_03953 [Capronia epimyces CBS 606.96]